MNQPVSRRITSLLIRSGSAYLLLARLSVGGALIYATFAAGSHPIWSWGSALIFISLPLAILCVQTFNRTTVSMTDKSPAILSLLLLIGALSLAVRAPIGSAWVWGTVESILVLSGVIMFWGLARMSNRRAAHLAMLYGYILVAALGATLYGAVQLVQDGSSRLTGFFPNSNHYCTLAGMGLAALAGLYGRLHFQRNPANRWLALIGVGSLALILVAGVFLSGSRGGAAAIAASALIVYAPKLFERRQTRLRLVALVVLALLIAQQALFEFAGWWSRLDDAGPAAVDRFNAAVGGLKLWLTEPLFGAGPGSFPYAYLRVQPDAGTGRWWHNSHCDYITFLADWGLAGFVLAALAGGLFVRRIIGFLRDSARSRDLAHAGDGSAIRAGLWLIAVPFVHSAVDFPLRDPCILWSAAAVAGGLSAVVSVRYNDPVDLRHNRWATVWILALSCIAVPLTVVGIRASAIAPARFDYKHRAPLPDVKAVQWLAAYEANPLDHRPLLIAVQHARFGDQPQSDALRCLPDDWQATARRLCPYDPRIDYFAGILRLDAGETDAGIEQLRAAAALAPGQPDLQLNVADFLLDVWIKERSTDRGLFDDAAAIYRNELLRSPEKTAPVIIMLSARGLPPNRWLSIVPDTPDARAEYAAHLLSIGMIDAANDALRPHREQLTGDRWLKLDATLALQTGRLVDAADAIKRLIAGARETAREKRIADAALIIRKAQQGRADRLRLLERLLAERPDNVALIERTAAARADRDCLAEFDIRFWELLREDFPSNTDIALQLGDSYFRFDRQQPMLELYETLLKNGLTRSRRALLLYRCALVRERLGAYGSATFDAEAAFAIDRRNESLIRLMASLYQKQDRQDKIKELIPHWIALYPDSDPNALPKDLRNLIRSVN